MIDLVPAVGFRRMRAFHHVVGRIYEGDPNWRCTEDDVIQLLVEGKSAYLRHAEVDPFLIVQDRQVVGRVSLIHDHRLPNFVQVAHFEARPGVAEGPRSLWDEIRLKARVLHPSCRKVVVGLHGHLNYGAGFLVSPHDRPPVFGLPYTPRYYLDYFDGLRRSDMVSYRFDNQKFYDLAHRATVPDLGDIRIRTMDRRHLARETDIYTYLNNACFQKHPYWADRTTVEDYELFHPFRFLMKEENLIFAEENGRPVGFLLWYPDFNELVGPGEALGPFQAARHHLRDRIRSMGRPSTPTTVRLTEIALLPTCRNRAVIQAMILQMIRSVEAGGYQHCEGGFIFEANRLSMAMTRRYLIRAFGQSPEPSRRYCVFEGDL